MVVRLISSSRERYEDTNRSLATYWVSLVSGPAEALGYYRSL